MAYCKASISGDKERLRKKGDNVKFTDIRSEGRQVVGFWEEEEDSAFHSSSSSWVES